MILSIIAYIVFILLIIPNFVAVLINNKKRSSFIKRVNDFWNLNAYEVDVFANTHYATLFNLTLRKANGYKFGIDKEETISSVLGKNQRNKTLSLTGWIVVYILWVIDVKYWFKGGHCLNYIKK